MKIQILSHSSANSKVSKRCTLINCFQEKSSSFYLRPVRQPGPLPSCRKTDSAPLAPPWPLLAASTPHLSFKVRLLNPKFCHLLPLLLSLGSFSPNILHTVLYLISQQLGRQNSPPGTTLCAQLAWALLAHKPGSLTGLSRCAAQRWLRHR